MTLCNINQDVFDLGRSGFVVSASSSLLGGTNDIILNEKGSYSLGTCLKTNGVLKQWYWIIPKVTGQEAPWTEGGGLLSP